VFLSVPTSFFLVTRCVACFAVELSDSQNSFCDQRRTCPTSVFASALCVPLSDPPLVHLKLLSTPSSVAARRGPALVSIYNVKLTTHKSRRRHTSRFWLACDLGTPRPGSPLVSGPLSAFAPRAAQLDALAPPARSRGSASERGAAKTAQKVGPIHRAQVGHFPLKSVFSTGLLETFFSLLFLNFHEKKAAASEGGGISQTGTKISRNTTLYQKDICASAIWHRAEHPKSSLFFVRALRPELLFLLGHSRRDFFFLRDSVAPFTIHVK
jgi:hypothetical protein